MKVKSTVFTLLAVGAMLAFTLGSITPVMAAGEKKGVKKMSEKVKKSKKKIKKKSGQTTKQVNPLSKKKINVNTASKEQLMLLPQIGEVKAEAIIKARKKNKFSSADDLMDVNGIGEKTLEAIKTYVKYK